MRTFNLVLIFTLFSALSLFSQVILLEAEDAELDQLTVSSSISGYSGSGYVGGFTNDEGAVTFRFQAVSGLFSLEIGFVTPHGTKGYELSVNSAQSTGQFVASDDFLAHDAGKFMLQNGTNTITIGKGWGWYYIDYIRLTPASVALPQKPEESLLNENATTSTKSLLTYLISIYGEKMLSGQQSMDDIEYVESITGKTPAIGVFDLIDYSPSRVEHGSNPTGSVESWIAWANANNTIISLSWHWNAPIDLIDEPGKEWWRGFYTYATTFDLGQALANKNGVRYQLLIRDMDVIAEELKKFQTQNIPVLWRPLHEVWGRWFWWGASGPEPFIELWKIMVDRFVNHHKLNNLIWVYTHRDIEWYPGDEYVDIVAMDIYTEQSSNMSGEWEATQKDFDGRKLVALSESGTLPEPDEVRAFGTWWAWFSLWSGDFIRDKDHGLLRSVYLDEDVITADELPDDLRNTNGDAEGHSGLGSKLQIFPNPSRGSLNIVVEADGTQEVLVQIYNVLGQSIWSQSVTAAEHVGAQKNLQAQNLPAGIYIVRAQVGNHKAVIQKLTVLP